jgi:L-iditol 2-dehydrogenase
MPEPACGVELVKIEVCICGVCGTDLHVLHDTFRKCPSVNLGHEFSGIVVETRRDVQREGQGDRRKAFHASAII